MKMNATFINSGSGCRKLPPLPMLLSLLLLLLLLLLPAAILLHLIPSGASFPLLLLPSARASPSPLADTDSNCGSSEYSKRIVPKRANDNPTVAITRYFQEASIELLLMYIMIRSTEISVVASIAAHINPALLAIGTSIIVKRKTLNPW